MKDEPKITMPDFQVWAENMINVLTYMTKEQAVKHTAISIKQAFDQGESYGVFKGYNAGYTRGHNEGFIKGQDSAQILRNLTDIVGGN